MAADPCCRTVYMLVARQVGPGLSPGQHSRKETPPLQQAAGPAEPSLRVVALVMSQATCSPPPRLPSLSPNLSLSSPPAFQAIHPSTHPYTHTLHMHTHTRKTLEFVFSMDTGAGGWVSATGRISVLSCSESGCFVKHRWTVEKLGLQLMLLIDLPSPLCLINQLNT